MAAPCALPSRRRWHWPPGRRNQTERLPCGGGSQVRGLSCQAGLSHSGARLPSLLPPATAPESPSPAAPLLLIPQQLALFSTSARLVCVCFGRPQPSTCLRGAALHLLQAAAAAPLRLCQQHLPTLRQSRRTQQGASRGARHAVVAGLAQAAAVCGPPFKQLGDIGLQGQQRRQSGLLLPVCCSTCAALPVHPATWCPPRTWPSSLPARGRAELKISINTSAGFWCRGKAKPSPSK